MTSSAISAANIENRVRSSKSTHLSLQLAMQKISQLNRTVSAQQKKMIHLRVELKKEGRNAWGCK